MKKIAYENLNAKQKENYNFQKIAAVLAEYGYSCMWLNDDWQGADFIANHIDGAEFLRVQLKGRLVVSKKYIGKNLHIAFRVNDKTYLYPHDEVLDLLLPSIENRSSWLVDGLCSWPNPLSKDLSLLLEQFEI